MFSFYTLILITMIAVITSGTSVAIVAVTLLVSYSFEYYEVLTVIVLLSLSISRVLLFELPCGASLYFCVDIMLSRGGGGWLFSVACARKGGDVFFGCLKAGGGAAPVPTPLPPQCFKTRERCAKRYMFRSSSMFCKWGGRAHPRPPPAIL